MAGYHFGWWDVHGVPTDADSGKALRAALTLSVAAAYGSLEQGCRAAAAVELMHNFTLIHDDVMDGDHFRRGRPTVWAVWDVGGAILLGDVLQSLAFRMVSTDMPATVSAAAAARLAAAGVEVCRGQQQDCLFETRTQVEMNEYIAMAAGKTGALMGCAAALGALCAGATEDAVADMETFGNELGLAFQFVDDIMGLCGDPATTGKPAGRDLLRRKRTLPIVAALESDTAAARSLAELYLSTQAIPPTEVAAAIELVVAAGGIQRAGDQAQARITTALAALPADLHTPDLVALAQLVAHRNR
ncbi:polyprenyl synthetase family protein [Nocardia sp. NPDC059091]